ncbi:MAG TPA: hypothetical protein VN577_03795 [Terriglobales bacterium]|nr:hypothetical protein [Terriglobales bacterium]
MGIAICVFAFVTTYVLARKSLTRGIAAVFAFGYIFGIFRANVPETASYFIFDSSVLALFISQHRLITQPFLTHEGQRLKHWVVGLMLWPILLFLVPLQDPMVQLVGLRGNIFLLPFILIGAQLKDEEIYQLALWLAALNVAACMVGAAEFIFGIEHFFPRNAITELIYRSNDVSSVNAYRIPSTFSNAHSYGGMMLISLPWIAGAWVQRHAKMWHKQLLLAGIITGMIGVFLSAARIHFVGLIIVITVFTFSTRLRPVYRVAWILVLVAVGYLVASNPRLQRFTTLSNSEYVTTRIQSSVNVSIFDAIYEYPFGVGLGGGGTSMPYFLSDRVFRPVVVESELGRIQLETGLIGTVAWLGFFLWVFTRPRPTRDKPWFLGVRMSWFQCLAFCLTGFIGIGLLTAIPLTAMLMLLLGWMACYHDKHTRVFASPAHSTFVSRPVANRNDRQVPLR